MKVFEDDISAVVGHLIKNVTYVNHESIKPKSRSSKGKLVIQDLGILPDSRAVHHLQWVNAKDKQIDQHYICTSMGDPGASGTYGK